MTQSSRGAKLNEKHVAPPEHRFKAKIELTISKQHNYRLLELFNPIKKILFLKLYIKSL